MIARAALLVALLAMIAVPVLAEAPNEITDQGQLLDNSEGVFSIRVGTGTPFVGAISLDLFAETNRYLEMHVDGEPLSPRRPVSSAPYALQASTVSVWARHEPLSPSSACPFHTEAGIYKVPLG